MLYKLVSLYKYSNIVVNDEIYFIVVAIEREIEIASADVNVSNNAPMRTQRQSSNGGDKYERVNSRSLGYRFTISFV